MPDGFEAGWGQEGALGAGPVKDDAASLEADRGPGMVRKAWGEDSTNSFVQGLL